MQSIVNSLRRNNKSYQMFHLAFKNRSQYGFESWCVPEMIKITIFHHCESLSLEVKVNSLCHEMNCLRYKPTWNIKLDFSSPEPKAQRWAYSMAGNRPSVNIFKWPPLIFFPYFTYSIYRWEERIIVVFCANRIRIPVAMATYSFHWLIMGEVESGIFCLLTADIYNFFLQKCFLSSPMLFIRILSKLLNFIGCHGNIKGKFSKNYSEIFSSEAIRGIKMKLSIHVHDISLHKLAFTVVAYVVSLLG